MASVWCCLWKGALGEAFCVSVPLPLQAMTVRDGFHEHLRGCTKSLGFLPHRGLFLSLQAEKLSPSLKFKLMGNLYLLPTS